MLTDGSVVYTDSGHNPFISSGNSPYAKTSVSTRHKHVSAVEVDTRSPGQPEDTSQLRVCVLSLSGIWPVYWDRTAIELGFQSLDTGTEQGTPESGHWNLGRTGR